MTDGDGGCQGKAPHRSSILQGDGGRKLSFSFTPPLPFLLRSQVNMQFDKTADKNNLEKKIMVNLLCFCLFVCLKSMFPTCSYLPSGYCNISVAAEYYWKPDVLIIGSFDENFIHLVLCSVLSGVYQKYAQKLNIAGKSLSQQIDHFDLRSGQRELCCDVDGDVAGGMKTGKQRRTSVGIIQVIFTKGHPAHSATAQVLQRAKKGWTFSDSLLHQSHSFLN